MDLQKLLSRVRRACGDYNMIEDGDKIAVAVSGGKDSLSVLAALSAMRKFYPVKYSLAAITVDLGFPGFDTKRIDAFCGQIGVPYSCVKTEIGKIVFEERRESNPCSLCAKMRKGAFNSEALKLKCNRVAYGHNRDDMLQTFFLSLFYEGRLHVPEPVAYLDRSGLHAIRPLIYVPEKEAAGFARAYGLPVVKSPCPADGNTKREDIKMYINELRLRYKNFDARTFTALAPLLDKSKRRG